MKYGEVKLIAKINLSLKTLLIYTDCSTKMLTYRLIPKSVGSENEFPSCDQEFLRSRFRLFRRCLPTLNPKVSSCDCSTCDGEQF